MVDKANAATTVQDLADKVKSILSNPELLARLAEKELEDGSVSALVDELEENVANLEKLYPTSD